MFKRRIICMHGINQSLTGQRFIRYIKWMRKLSYHFVSLEEILSGNCPCRSLALTIDDAYKNCITGLLPILQEYNIKATLFVPPGLLGLNANDSKLLHHKCYENEATMSWEDLKLWQSEGHTIGFHTDSHIDLFHSNETDIRKDFLKGIYRLQQAGLSPRYFAYPFGFLPKNRNDFEQLMQQYGINHAFTIHWGNVNPENRFYIKRFSLGDSEPLFWSMAKSIGLVDWYYINFKRYDEQIQPDI